MQIKKFFLNFLVLFLVGELIFSVVLIEQVQKTIAHESNHVKINANYGAESHVEYNDFGLFGTEPKTIRDTNYFSITDERLASLAHSINESVAYNTSAFFSLSLILQTASFIVLTAILGVLLKNQKN